MAVHRPSDGCGTHRLAYEDRIRDRRVTFLELFFDLVFVVVIAQLVHRLAEHPSWSGVGWFLFLFCAVWSSWTNGTLYHDLHTTNDVSVRVFTFGQMLAVTLMAVYIGHVPGEGVHGFALAYAASNLLLAILWFRTGLHDPAQRPASIRREVRGVVLRYRRPVDRNLGSPSAPFPRRSLCALAARRTNVQSLAELSS